jgi:hypothetical protein
VPNAIKELLPAREDEGAALQTMGGYFSIGFVGNLLPEKPSDGAEELPVA